MPRYPTQCKSLCCASLLPLYFFTALAESGGARDAECRAVRGTADPGGRRAGPLRLNLKQPLTEGSHGRHRGALPPFPSPLRPRTSARQPPGGARAPPAGRQPWGVRREAGLPSAAITPAPSESCLYPSGGRALRRFPGGGWSSGRRRKGAARARRVGPVTSGEAAGRPRRAAAARQDGTWRGERGAPRRLKWDGCCRMARKGVPAPCRGFLVPYADTSLLNKVTLGSEWTSVRN